jgi:hypothetical protein
MTWLRFSLVEIWTVSGSSRQDRFAGPDRVQALAARRPEPVLFLQLVERDQFRLFRDPDRALALHVRVPAHRADAGAGLADVPAQEQQVDDHRHVPHAVAVLGQAHAVDAEYGAGARIHGGCILQRRALQARFAFDPGPAAVAHGLREVVEALGVLLDEFRIEHALCAGRHRRVVEREDRLAQAHDGGRVAARLHLMILGADRRLLPGQHLERRLRIGEADQAALAQRIEGDDRHAAAARLLQLASSALSFSAGRRSNRIWATSPTEPQPPAAGRHGGRLDT